MTWWLAYHDSQGKLTALCLKRNLTGQDQEYQQFCGRLQMIHWQGEDFQYVVVGFADFETSEPVATWLKDNYGEDAKPGLSEEGHRMSETDGFLSQAIALARENVTNGGRPFGAVVVKDGVVIANGVNETAATADPTAHAELMAIRAASKKLQRSRLDGCIVYASGHPCPMCFAAMAMAGIEEVFYAYSNEDGEPYGLSSASLYAQLARPAAERSLKMTYVRVRPDGEKDAYELWRHANGLSDADK